MDPGRETVTDSKGAGQGRTRDNGTAREYFVGGNIFFSCCVDLT